MGAEGLTIGQLARQAGVHVETVRYYQRLGLIVEPPRAPRGVRRYRVEVVDQLRFIQRAKALGFTLAQVGELLAIGTGGCAETRRLAEQKLEEISRKINELEAISRALCELVTRCAETPRGADCPLIQHLAEPREA